MVSYLKSIALFSAVTLPLLAGAQLYPVGTIPEELKKGSNAVVRYSETVFEYSSPTLSKTKSTFIVTVLNEEGGDMSIFYEYTDKFSSLSGFSGEIFDANGRSLRKIRQSELQFTDYSGAGSYDDNRRHYCDPSTPPPPYTIKYEWEKTNKNGNLTFPSFYPQGGMFTGVQKAIYRMILPAGTKFYAQAYNLDISPDTKNDGRNDIYEWKVENMTPMSPEPFSRPRYELWPVVYFSPDQFIYDGVPGSMRDWESYSQWQWKLLENRSEMPAELKTHIAELTMNASTDMEKVRLLYDYLGETTRYVSVQIGIGGLQPISASNVYKTKHGDCKALSNYMHGMLAECGIKSYYSKIGINRRSFPREFASPAMGDHVILMVPLGADTLWVECTNPELPLGYRHKSIVGKNSLVCKDGSGEIIQVPRYPDSLNLSIRKADVVMDKDGYVTAHVATENHLHIFRSYMAFGKQNSIDRLNTLRSQVDIPVAFISNPTYREVKTALPYSVIEYDLESNQLGSRTGERLFVNVMLFRKPLSTKFGRAARKEDIKVQEGYCDRDITFIKMPESVYEIEAMPQDVYMDTKYGTYSMQVRPKDGGLEIERYMLLRTDLYDKGEIEDFKAFMETISKADTGKIILKKKG